MDVCYSDYLLLYSVKNWEDFKTGYVLRGLLYKRCTCYINKCRIISIKHSVKTRPEIQNFKNNCVEYKQNLKGLVCCGVTFISVF